MCVAGGGLSGKGLVLYNATVYSDPTTMLTHQTYLWFVYCTCDHMYTLQPQQSVAHVRVWSARLGGGGGGR